MADETAVLVGRTAHELAALVRAGEVRPVDVVRAHLERIAELDAVLGAFQTVRAEAAVAEAVELERRADISALPLAGIPVAVKDCVDVAGEPTRCGSLTSDPGPRPDDHELVRRLRAAGAIIVGKTRVPELCAWPWTDGTFGVTRNPWDLSRTAGGSSGGSAAAVASGMVPIAHGSDGGGSVRIPAAACGLVGVKPGAGVVPGDPGRSGWHGLSVNGALATTVADAALLLSVLADQPGLAAVAPPARPLRIAVSVKPQLRTRVDDVMTDAVLTAAGLLGSLGHTITLADPPLPAAPLLTAGVRATSGMAEEASGVPLRRLERRNRPQVAAGRLLRRAHVLRDGPRERFRAAALAFFTEHDVLLTPTIARPPVPAEGWMQRGWLPNVRGSSYAAFTGAWNVAGLPAVAVPGGEPRDGLPVSVQVIGGEGQEATLLALAAQLELQWGWPRHPAIGPAMPERGESARGPRPRATPG